MSITKLAEYTGEVNIAQNKFSAADLQVVVDTEQIKILKELLGDDLYLKFEADFFGVVADGSTRVKYQELLNGFVYVSDSTGHNIDYVGLKRMIRLFTYWKFTTSQQYQNTIIGTVEGSSRNAFNSKVQQVSENAEERYNIGVDLRNLAVSFIEDNNEVSYTTTSIADQTGNIYLVSLASTKYIVNSDTVTINNTDYVVSNLIANTSFEITETSGTVFATGSAVKFELFPTFETKPKKKIYFRGLI